MKLPVFSLLLSTLGLALLASSSLAQGGGGSRTLLPPVGVPSEGTATFTIPTSTDPDSVTFTSSGQTFAFTDQNNPITGQRLYQPSFSFNGGLDIFAAVPGPIGNISTTIPIVEVDIFTPYTGILTLISQSGVSGYDPWFIERLNPAVGQGFRFFKTLSAQANINTTDPANDPLEFAYLDISPINPNDPNDPNTVAFFNAPFTITGYTSVQNVPEPSTIALLGALAVSGGVAWRRRRKLS